MMFVIGLIIIGVVFLFAAIADSNTTGKMGPETSPKGLGAFTKKENPFQSSSELDAIPETFVVFDVETTGLDAFQNEIIEIAAIKVHRDQAEHQTYTALVKPSKPIPPQITALNGITNEMVGEKGIPLENALEEFRVFIGKEKLVAFNKDFDKTFINAAAEKLGKKPIVKHVTCAYKKAKAAWPGLKSYKLADLAKMGGLSDDGTHRALADCKRTMIVYKSAAQIVKNKYRGTSHPRKKQSKAEGLISLEYEMGKDVKITRNL